MKVHELISKLQQLGIERQNDEVTRIYDDFPHPVREVAIESKAFRNYPDHYNIDYFPEVHDPEDAPLESIVVLQ